ncbi:DUF1003 domain-containing protein [Patescibacteria group bacterium]|nr:MAG: DUF1003 domain-containing protein [Patescibacteria group bacterium]
MAPFCFTHIVCLRKADTIGSLLLFMLQKQKKSLLEEWSRRCRTWIGSLASLVVHTILFILFFLYGYIHRDWEVVLLILTTVVSLEAIYLSIFIQMTVNRNTQSLQEVEEEIGEIQENIGEIQEEVDEIAEEPGSVKEENSAAVTLKGVQKVL